jgi:LTXXQ motif family protein
MASKGADLTAIRRFTGIVLVVASVFAANIAWGQQGSNRGTSGVSGGSKGADTSHLPPQKGPSAEIAPMTVLAAVQYRLELLEEDLRLRPEQSALWLAYRDRVIKLAEDTQRSARMALSGDMPAPKRLDNLADIARDRLTAIEDIVDAGNRLYATLSPAQLGVADRRLAVPVMALVGVEPNSAAARAAATTKSP